MSEQFIDPEQLATEAARAILIEKFRQANLKRALYAMAANDSDNPKADPNDKVGMMKLEEVDRLGAELIKYSELVSHEEPSSSDS